MGWATHYIEELRAGRTATFRPRGNSMSGKVESGQLVTVMPITDDTPIAVGDIVLCTVKGKQFLHLINAVSSGRFCDRFQIANARGGINGWTSRRNIHGKLTKVEA